MARTEQMLAPVLQACGVSAGYGFGSKSATVLHNVDLAVAPGQTIGLVGESGSGKSTLAKVLVGQLAPSAGKVLLAGADVGSMSRRELQAARRTIQLIPQDPYASLDPRMTVGRVLQEALNPNGRRNATDSGRVTALLETVALDGSAVSKLPHEFSGGQRQRIAIARALAVEPKVVIADEVTSALDSSVQAEILNLLRSLQEAQGLAYIFVTHDLSIADYMCDELSVLYLGQIVEQGGSDLLRHPNHPYSRLLLDSVPDPAGNFLAADAVAVRATSDEPADPAHPPSGCSFHPRCGRPGRTDSDLRVCADDIPALLDRGVTANRRWTACHFPLTNDALPRKA